MKAVFAIICAGLMATFAARGSDTVAQGIDLVMDIDTSTILLDLNEATKSDIRRALKRLDLQSEFDLSAAGLKIRTPDSSRLAQARATISAILSDGIYPHMYAIAMTTDGVALTLTETYKTRLFAGVAERSQTILAQRLDVPLSAVTRNGARLTLHYETARDYRLALQILYPPRLSIRWALDSAPDSALPDGVELLAYARKESKPPPPIAVEKRVLVEGDDILNAGWTTDAQCGCITVTLGLAEKAAHTFADLTKANIGKRMAIVMGNEVLTAPTIREPILGGTMQIEGDFTAKTANDLAALIRAGAVPAPVKVIRCTLKRKTGHWEPCEGLSKN